MKLTGQVAIVTGAGSGIGASTAALFAAEGARVVVADLNLAAAETVAAACGGLAVQVDVADSASVAAMVAATMAAFGRIDILIANAGYGIRGSVTETAEADWDRLMGVNLKGVFLCAKAVIPVMAAQGGGAIVATASAAAQVALADRAAYVASKGGVAALTRAMAVDHAGQNIRVNAVLPGTIWSPYFDQILAKHEDPPAFVAALNARAPMGRTGTPDEIAKAMLWLASGDASFATGTLLSVDGGMTAW